MVSTTASSITIQWDSWQGYVEPQSMQLIYNIQMKMNESIIWFVKAELLTEDGDYHSYSYTINCLKVNTRYEFRIEPRIKWRGVIYRGLYLHSDSIKTSCGCKYSICYFALLFNIDVTFDYIKSTADQFVLYDIYIICIICCAAQFFLFCLFYSPK